MYHPFGLFFCVLLFSCFVLVRFFNCLCFLNLCTFGFEILSPLSSCLFFCSQTKCLKTIVFSTSPSFFNNYPLSLSVYVVSQISPLFGKIVFSFLLFAFVFEEGFSLPFQTPPFVSLVSPFFFLLRFHILASLLCSCLPLCFLKNLRFFRLLFSFPFFTFVLFVIFFSLAFLLRSHVFFLFRFPFFLPR